MKKSIILLLFFATMFTLSGCDFISPTENEEPDNTLEYVDLDGLGRSINVVEADDYNNYITGYSVLDSALLKDLEVFSLNIEDTYFKTFSSTTISDLKTSASAGFSIEVGAEGSFQGMYMNASSGFTQSSTLDYSTHTSHYFYVHQKIVQKSNSYILNYNEIEYSSMLSESFLSALEDVQNEELSYTSLFRMYGTHIIVSAIYGGRADAYYSIATSDATIDQSNSSSFNAAIGAGVTGVGGGSSDIKTSIETELGLSSSQIDTSFYGTFIGGSTFLGSNFDDFVSYQADWANSFNTDDSYVLIDFAEDGLIPLWDILPTEYTDLRQPMMDAFVAYYENGIYELQILFSEIGSTTNTYFYNSDSYNKGIRRITDTGKFGMSSDVARMDHLHLNSLSGFMSDDFVFRFDITLNITEIDKGYQEVWLYNAFQPADIKSTSSIFRGELNDVGLVNGNYSISASGSALQDIPGNESVTLYATGSDIHNDMYLKYDANGDYNDDWDLNRSTVQVTAIPVEHVHASEQTHTIIDTGFYGLGTANVEAAKALDFSPFTGEFTSDYIYTIILKVEMSEINDGYQEFYLYNDISNTTNVSQTEEVAIAEYGLVGSSEDLEYPSYVHNFEYGVFELDNSRSTVYVILQVTGDQLQEDMYLRFDCGGDGEDSWNLYKLDVFVYNELKD